MEEEEAKITIDLFQKHYEESKHENEEYSPNDEILQKGNYLCAYLKTISDYISKYQGETLEDLFETIKKTSDLLIKGINNKKIIPKFRTILSLQAESELMLYLLHKYASKKSVEDFATLKSTLLKITQDLSELSSTAKEKISKLFSVSMKNNLTVLVHGYSSTIAYALIQAKKSGKRFKVIVSKAEPSNSGNIMHELLKKNQIESKLICDSSIGFYMKDVDYVLVGADAVCENGGIVNKIGTYTIAIVANNFKKPFYVLSDSLKFIKMYPINQVDVQEYVKKFSFEGEQGEEVSCDYTPPEFIHLFFTDIGILTPGAVSDEFIQIFYT
ncbi:MAG: hypothetical protein MJ252_25020 [archaeon]|nr:hypothetical protein [archaeon]